MYKSKKCAKKLISNLSTKLYSLFKNLLAPQNCTDQEYEMLKKVLQEHLNPKPLRILIRHIFLTGNKLKEKALVLILTNFALYQFLPTTVKLC